MAFLGCQQDVRHETDQMLHNLLLLNLDHLQFLHALISHNLQPLHDTFNVKAGALMLRTLCLSCQFVRPLFKCCNQRAFTAREIASVAVSSTLKQS